MSVINRVLKDLDRQGGATAMPKGVETVLASAEPLRRRWLWLPLPVIAVLGWWLWPAAQPVHAPLQASEPRLRMSEVLTLPSPFGTPAGAGEGSKAPALTARLDTHPHEPPRDLPRLSLSPVPLIKPLPFGTPRGEGRTALALAARLDTHLPEPRAPRVVKETLPPSAGEQAESAWLRASRQIEQGRNTEAVASLEAALNLDPGHAPARQSLIALSLEMGDAQRAEALLREGLARFPNDSWYDRALAQITLQRGDTTRAASLLKAGLGKGVDAAYWGFYAGVLKQDGRVAESAQAWREAARLNPAHGPWWLGLAVTLEQSGARPDAAAAYQRALQTRLSPELRDYAAKKAAELATP